MVNDFFKFVENLYVDVLTRKFVILLTNVTQEKY